MMCDQTEPLMSNTTAKIFSLWRGKKLQDSDLYDSNREPEQTDEMEEKGSHERENLKIDSSSSQQTKQPDHQKR